MKRLFNGEAGYGIKGKPTAHTDSSITAFFDQESFLASSINKVFILKLF
ncbi:MAG: hypothetical protein LBJ00_11070 [Planctomycetaceae bacterium]|nr:hypothetical protein [Planctomycetaceae bacterium]